MKVLWLTWKDSSHPQAGGAELVNEELAARMAADGHEVHFLVGGYQGCRDEETRGGFRITRLGGKWSVYWKAFRYYRRNLKGWADVVIEEVNTVPFFSKYYVTEKNILFFHQLCREIWFYQMFFPLNVIGYMSEPVYLRLLNDRSAIVISQSTKNDLIRYGFSPDRIDIIINGLDIRPIEELSDSDKKKEPTILYLGSLRKMKRPHHVLRAFEIAKEEIKDLKLVIAGGVSDTYGHRFLRLIKQSPYSNSVEYIGHVALDQKIQLLRECHLICVASVKEGWGLIVPEANSQGMPAVAYNVDGLRDSIQHGVTGLLTQENSPESMAKSIVRFFSEHKLADNLKLNAWNWSKSLDYDKTYNGFISAFQKL